MGSIEGSFGRGHCCQQLLTKDLLWSEEHDLFKETETVAREERENNVIVIFLEKRSGQGSNALGEQRTGNGGWPQQFPEFSGGNENAGSKQI